MCEENFKSNDYVWNSVPTYAGLLRKRFKVGFPIRKISKIFGNCMKYSRSVERKIDLAVNKAWPAGWLIDLSCYCFLFCFCIVENICFSSLRWFGYLLVFSTFSLIFMPNNVNSSKMIYFCLRYFILQSQCLNGSQLAKMKKSIPDMPQP